MPQMAPMSWTMLFLMFISMVVLINMMMYFNKNYLTKKELIKSKMKMMNWKW
uniref:ATPase subunit 8 n=1 Tax=Metrocoris sp. XD-2019 TaxID=2581068 RepID=A0A5B9XWY1_9HEMI|nr:ATPase subunit 8 [Metrocoris sp. XD-2019]